ncbi:MAG: bifunctional diaminohydroxyphosphoribosylaminopyrimidine deaminase/5-amino-6-(5-phosphoribosylamino)uracil reductase RibD [Desulfuromonadales bacterium]|nr:bifunctional diaminohydroxyphosphoribosylaminopyrimidine deaminase/5-amino-6-(5-phosphoribosylamino)uracil reductase RibD [Desulfuromonadales bacterium]
MSQIDEKFMSLALELAQRGAGRTAPNPPVGAVVVRDGAIIGEGFHPMAGEPHAEIFALRQAGDLASGSDLYVTLEPCSHHGRTGPCADAVIEAGIRRVFVGVQDPNPQVAGRGIERLRTAGIEVVCGVLERDCRRLIAPFARHVLSGMPYTIYKTAMTLDGKTATAKGDSRWISGERSRAEVHRLRDRVEAIMVGVGTVLHDDPLLNTRLPGGGRDPLRVVVDSHLRMPADAAMLRQASAAGTLIATTEAAGADARNALELAGAEILVLPQEQGHVSLPDLWRELGRRNVQTLLLEGGATLAGAALRSGLIDRVMVFVAPKLIGGDSGYGIFAGAGCSLLGDAVKLEDVHTERFDMDVLISGEVVKCSPG